MIDLQLSTFGWPTASASQKVRLTQSLSTIPILGTVGFFNAHPLNQASLFRGFTLKKPSRKNREGFVARPGFEPGTSGL
jgi:hypothetical protein